MTIFPPSLQLNLSENQLCGLNVLGEGTYNAEGITAIADALRVTASLTRLNVARNYLNRGGNGVELLRDAVREREGFKLIANWND